MTSEKKNEEAETLGDTLDIHYVKVSDYRPLHIDGGFGGITNHGYIYLGLYSERGPIPRTVTYAVEKLDDQTAQLRDEVRKVSKEGVVREVLTGLYLDKQTAINLRDWLNDRIKSLPEEEKSG